MFLVLHRQSKANVLLILKKSKTWRMVVVCQGSCLDEYLTGKMQVTHMGEEKFLLSQLIPFPWAAQWWNYMCNTTTLQSFCQHSCWSQMAAYLAAGVISMVETAGDGDLCYRPCPSKKTPPALAILAICATQTLLCLHQCRCYLKLANYRVIWL